MSISQISRSSDLVELESIGYRLEVRGRYLIVSNIPYVTANGEIEFAKIVTSLETCTDSGNEITQQPSDHTVWWTGEEPYTSTGECMRKHLCCDSWENGLNLGEEIRVFMQFSRKPKKSGKTRKYFDYREKIETYVNEVAGQADGLKPGVLEAAKKGGDPITIVSSSNRFKYMDTNSYRNGTKAIESCIEEEIVAVIGVGGTGSYLVDFLAKTNVKELHLIDNDTMKVHNGFRVAGAARVEELNGKKYKIDWHKERYENVREVGLNLHCNKLSGENLEELRNFTTVFIAVDDLDVRRDIQRACGEMGVCHIAVGIGLEIEGASYDQIGGMVKVEINIDPGEIPADKGQSIESEENEREDVYDSNIQTSELNMFGAAMAITEWKAAKGFYRSTRNQDIDSIMYSVSTGEIVSDKKGIHSKKHNQ